MVSEQKLIFYLLNGGQATVYVMGAGNLEPEIGKDDDKEWLKVSCQEGRMYDEKDCPIYCGTSLGGGKVTVKATSKGDCASFLLENVLSVDKITSSDTTTIYMKTTYVVQREKRKHFSLPILDGPKMNFMFKGSLLIIKNKVGVPSDASIASWLNKHKPEGSDCYAIPVSMLSRVVVQQMGRPDMVVYQAKK